MSREGRVGSALLYRMIEDISERKRAAETIANERALLRAAVDAVPERIYVKDREGLFLLQNAANVRAHGAASYEELLGKTVYDIFPRDVAERVEAEDRGLIESGKSLIDRERVSTDAHGRKSWVVASKVPLRDAANNVVGIVGVNRDITARKLAEQALKESEEQFRQLANNIPQVFWMTGIDQKELIYVSPAYEARRWAVCPESEIRSSSGLRNTIRRSGPRCPAGRAQQPTAIYDHYSACATECGQRALLHDRALRDMMNTQACAIAVSQRVNERSWRAAADASCELRRADEPPKGNVLHRPPEAGARAGKRNQCWLGVLFI